MAKRDYYEVLGVDKNADDQTIKKAFKRLAMKYHPDRNHEADAEEKFKEINEAYAILSDSQKKQAYDQYGFAGVDPNQAGGAGGGFGGFGGADFGDNIFVNSRFFLTSYKALISYVESLPSISETVTFPL